MAGIRSTSILSGAPIAELSPLRLAHGAMAIVGDAAQLISPMTGRGYLTSEEDARELSHELAKLKSDEPIANALARY